jgi:hypothetical protein
VKATATSVVSPSVSGSATMSVAPSSCS